jgi:hypothetical protein
MGRAIGEGVGVATADPLKTYQTQSFDSAITGDVDKALGAITARLMAEGYSLHELACGGYLVARWDRTLHCSDLAGVRQFYSRIGGR